MSNKCRTYSSSKLGLEPPDNKKAFYAGCEAALAEQVQEPVAWPKPGPENPTWTICPKFLENIMRSSASEYMPGLEEIEAVLLALRTLYERGFVEDDSK